MAGSFAFGIRMILDDSLTWTLVLDNGKFSTDSKITGVIVMFFGLAITIQWIISIIERASFLSMIKLKLFWKHLHPVNGSTGGSYQNTPSSKPVYFSLQKAL